MNKLEPTKYIFVLNGRPRAGKDSFANFLADHLEKQDIWTEIHSTVKSIKEAAKTLGWDGVKNEHGRNALSSLKDWSAQWFDHSFSEIEHEIECMNNDDGIILMIREPEEISRVKRAYPKTVTVFIQRNGSEQASNHADTDVENFEYDYYIDNNRSLTQLDESAERLVSIIVNSERKK